MDVLVSVNDAAPLLLRNLAAKDNHWLGIKLVGKKSNRDAIGARVTYQAGDLKRSRTKVGGGSYLSSHDPRVVLGLGKQTKDRLAGSEVAGAQWQNREVHRPANRQVHHHHRRRQDLKKKLSRAQFLG